MSIIAPVLIISQSSRNETGYVKIGMGDVVWDARQSVQQQNGPDQIEL